MPSEFFKALSDDTRLRLLFLIAHNQRLCVCDLEAATLESQPKVSRHLAVLRKAGLVKASKQGLWVYYSLAKSIEPWQSQVIHNALKHSLEFMQVSQNRLEEYKQHENHC